MCRKLRLFLPLLLSLLFSPSLLADTPNFQIAQLAKKYLGGKYRWGGTQPSGFDCSGYTRYIFNKIGIKLPRTAYEQSKIGERVTGVLHKGDLLFFNTDPTRGIPITHVGVYLEQGKFIHAASKKQGIIISPLAGKYQRCYRGAKRVLSHGEPTQEEGRAIRLPKDFFIPFQQALKAPTQVRLTYDPLVLYHGQYLRQSQLKELTQNARSESK